MLFNSIDFLIFLPIVFCLYWFVTHKKVSTQNLLIVVASYVFYGWWDWRFLSLIILSTLIDYQVGKWLEVESKDQKRKHLLWISLGANLGFLGVFKYYNFFAANLVTAFEGIGVSLNIASLNVILPVGISFYTFQTLSYTIDVYRKKIQATHQLTAFAAYVSFFPQLVAGPIERATHLLPQFQKPREFSYNNAVDGLRQILWGLFKKVVIADNCAHFANMIFDNPADQSGSTLALGALFFTFQIYGDFSGYSDIAIGTARVFGFDLMRNFAYPYFSRDIAEFWRRWHISLSTWFRDYLYIPLGGSRGHWSNKIRNTFIIFLVSGFWHGANWTFIVWGFLNAIYFLPLLLSNKNRDNLGIVAQESSLPNLKEFTQILTTFALTVFAWIFFRAESLTHAFEYISGIFSSTLLSLPEMPYGEKVSGLFAYILLFIAIEWIGRRDQYGIEKLGLTWKRPIRWAMYYGLIMAIVFSAGKEQQFIYFQF